jgi:hypothetical protein
MKLILLSEGRMKGIREVERMRLRVGKILQKAVLALVSLAVFMLVLPACAVDPSRLSYLDEKITVAGLSDEEITVSIGELVALESVSEKAEGLRSNGDIVKFTAVGPTLDTFLTQYGKSKTDYTGVRFSSTDGYSVIIPRELLEKREIVLAYMNGTRSLDKQNKPLRVIVIGERAMYWARMVNRIEFLSDADVTLTSKIVFLDTVLPAMGGTYSEEEGGDIVSTIDLLGAYGGMTEGGKVNMQAYDGLKKTETIENFLKGYLKYTGDMTPQFCSPDLPEGMNMDGIISARTGGVVYYSLARAMEGLPIRDFEGQIGIGATDIIRDVGFVSSDTFRLETVDGTLKLVSAADLAVGIFVEEGGSWSFIGPDGLKVTDIAVVESLDATMESMEQTK